jgi:hypothetical protein
MDKMKSGIMLAVVLGILLGIGLAYSPSLQSNATTARPQLLMQPVAQGNIGAASSNTHASPSTDQTLIPIVVGLLIAIPVFLLARRLTRE